MDGHFDKVESVFQSFREMNRTLFQLIRKEAASEGITAIQMIVLRAIYENPEIGLSELSNKTFTGVSTLSGIIDRLVQAELVVRERSAADRRSITLRLTEDGNQKYQNTFKRVIARFSVLLELPESSLDELLYTHSKILQFLQNALDTMEGDLKDA